MNTSVEFVDYQEALSIKVGKAILAKGFDLASCTGVALNQLNSDSALGILNKDPEAKPLKLLVWSHHPTATQELPGHSLVQ